MRFSRAIALGFVLLAVGAHANGLPDVGAKVGSIKGFKTNLATEAKGMTQSAGDALTKSAKSVTHLLLDKLNNATNGLISAPPKVVDHWKSAVLLAWLKETGVYDKLNATAGALGAPSGVSSGTVPADALKAQLQSLSLLKKLNSTAGSDNNAVKNALVFSWLKETGALDMLASLHGNASSASAPAAGEPNAIDAFASADAAAAAPAAAAEPAAEPAAAPEAKPLKLHLPKLPFLGGGKSKSALPAPAAPAAAEGGDDAHAWLKAQQGAALESYNKALAASVAQANAKLAEAQAAAQSVSGQVEGKLKSAADALSSVARYSDSLKQMKMKTGGGAEPEQSAVAADALNEQLKSAVSLLGGAFSAADGLRGSDTAATAQSLAGGAAGEVNGKLKQFTDALAAAQAQADALKAALGASASSIAGPKLAMNFTLPVPASLGGTFKKPAH